MKYIFVLFRSRKQILCIYIFFLNIIFNDIFILIIFVIKFSTGVTIGKIGLSLNLGKTFMQDLKRMLSFAGSLTFKIKKVVDKFED